VTCALCIWGCIVFTSGAQKATNGSASLQGHMCCGAQLNGLLTAGHVVSKS
jgi:hypothetical protein